MKHLRERMATGASLFLFHFISCAMANNLPRTWVVKRDAVLAVLFRNFQCFVRL